MIDHGVNIPEGLVVGEDPDLDAKRFRVSEKGICLITQDDDRQAGALAGSEPMQVLAVTPEIFPLIKTGGLADVTGALPLALARQGVTTRTLIPGYPAVMKALQEEAGRCTNMPRCRAARLRSTRAKVGGLDLLVLDAPHLFDRPGGPYGDADGRGLAGQLAALRGAEPGRRRHRRRRDRRATCPTSCMRMTGRRR